MNNFFLVSLDCIIAFLFPVKVGGEGRESRDQEGEEAGGVASHGQGRVGEATDQ
jgi:hypothetical protein